jgi:cytochrome c-type biogenesis protein CcmH/NrfG
VERQSKVAEVAAAPLPTALPLAGNDGVDADGYPRKWVDRAALRSLLRAERYADLTRYFEELQSAFETDPRKEYWITDAAAAFSSGEAELLPPLNAWVDASPQSFAPYLARGAYRTSLGFLLRGGRWASETHEGDFAAMEDAHKKALIDLEHALSIRPQTVAALDQEIRVHMAASADASELRSLASKVAATCPTCLLPRIRMMHALEPRWGGSYDAMTELAKKAPVAKNPQLRFLPAYVELDRAFSLRHDGKLDEALAANERACALGEYWESLLDRALTFEAKKDLGKAERDVARANELRPGEPKVLFPLARIALVSQRWDAAGQALINGLRIDPTNADGRRLLPSVVQGLVYQGSQQYKAGRKDDALRAIELAIGLDPQSQPAKGLKNYILIGPTSGADDIEKLRAAAVAAPNDFRAHQALDYALAKQRRFAEVVEMWTSYLEANPRDGKAHLERGGAFFQLGKRDDARADAKAACELGVSEGCAHAK